MTPPVVGTDGVAVDTVGTTAGAVTTVPVGTVGTRVGVVTTAPVRTDGTVVDVVITVPVGTDGTVTGVVASPPVETDGAVVILDTTGDRAAFVGRPIGGVAPAIAFPVAVLCAPSIGTLPAVEKLPGFGPPAGVWKV